MKVVKLFIGLLIFLSFNSCTKQNSEQVLDFDVSVLNSAKLPATNFNVGDTVQFVFNGNPDQISFFSGEVGRCYENINRTSDTSNNVVFNFSNTLTNKSNGSLQLLVSSSFPGYTQINARDSLSILSTYPSQWTDISSRATWSTGTGAKSSQINLRDFAALNAPIYIGFRYAANGKAAQSSWTLSNIGLRHIISNNSYCIDSSSVIVPTTLPATVESPGWGEISIANPLIKFSPNVYAGNFSGVPNFPNSMTSNASTSTFTVSGNATPATAATTETWIVTGPIDLHKVIPDAGVAVKDMTSNATSGHYSGLSSWANYAYVFSKPGTYNLTFLASSNSNKNISSLKKSILITVH
jgi:hypothetical protein